MKSFIASFFGTVAGVVICCGLLIAMTIGGLILMAAIGNKSVEIEHGAWLVMDLSAVNITDTPPLMDEFGLSSLLSSQRAESVSLRSVTRALRSAANDSRIAGVYLTGALSPEGYGSGLAVLGEIRGALIGFRKAGKPVKAFFEQPTTAELYLAAGSNELAVDPFGLIVMPGLSAEPMFFAGAFERFGIGVQVTRVGKYKSAVEPYVRTDLSPESREQLQLLLDELWEMVMIEISRDRGMDIAELQQLVDRHGLISPEVALAAGLITRVAYRDEVLEDLLAATGRDGLEGFAQVDLRDYAKQVLTANRADLHKAGRIAIVYAEGAIVDGEGSDGEVGGARFSREIRALRQDDDIAAIVLRVNSPGGSASASEQILRELQLAREVKPVVVSMGTYAASGGYWISTAADRVFVFPTTITGSIGVFGLQMNVQKLANNLGVTWDEVKTGALAGALSVSRPKTEAELMIFQRMVDWTYGEFLQRVSKARGLTTAQVDEIAQGRVWSGAHALELGLADEFGGLEHALRYAADRVGIDVDQVIVEEFPRTLTLTEALGGLVANMHPHQVKLGPLERVFGQLTEGVQAINQFNDPHGIYARLPLEVSSR